MAMDVDQCPRESRTLQPDYTSKRKIKAFSHDGAYSHRIDTTSCALARTFDAPRRTNRMISALRMRRFLRQRRNIDEISVFDTSVFLATAAIPPRAQRKRTQKPTSQRGAKRVVKLVKKILRQRPRKALRTRNPMRIERIGQSDSRARSSAGRVFVSPRDRTRQVFRSRASGRMRKTHPVRRTLAPTHGSACAQRSSLRLSRSFTACGFALPPDAFIT
jgi:hypothetical protein